MKKSDKLTKKEREAARAERFRRITNKYNDLYCDKLIEYFRTQPIEKLFIVNFCVHAEISPDTFYSWLKKKPEFKAAFIISDAIKSARINEASTKSLIYDNISSNQQGRLLNHCKAIKKEDEFYNGDKKDVTLKELLNNVDNLI